jgi:phosphohistidine phosphatase
MKTLLLIRHAKASRAHPGLSDHDRPLDDRGLRDAPDMGRRLKHKGLQPQQVLTSTALRAGTTAALMAGALELESGRVMADERLYASSVTNLLYVIQELDDALTCVALVGHNPEMTELARHFAPEVPDMPTCAVAQLDFELARWSDIDACRVTRMMFDVPRKGQE